MTDRRPSPGFRPTDRSLPIALLRAREPMLASIRAMLAESPVNEQKWRILRVLDEGGQMEQTAIAQATCLLLPSLTRMLQSMEAEGLLARRAHEVDRRKTVVELTDAGRALIARYADRSRAILEQVEQQLGQEKLELLLSLLDDVQRLALSPGPEAGPEMGPDAAPRLRPDTRPSPPPDDGPDLPRQGPRA